MAARTRVVHVTTRLIRGGGDENTLFTVNGLDPARFDATLVVGGPNADDMIARVAPAVRLVQIPELVRSVHPRHDAVALARMTALFARVQPHIVHTHMAKGGMIGRLAAMLAGVPTIIHTLHGRTFHEHLGKVPFEVYRNMERVAGGYTDAMICVGEDVQAWYADHGVAQREIYRVIRSGMDLDDFAIAAAMSTDERQAVRRSMGVPETGLLVGMVARFTKGKGHHHFLDVVEQVVRRIPDVPLAFAMIGDGELMTTYREDVARRGLSDRVTFTGFRTDIARVMGALDLHVFTSLWEGLPRVLVQANAAGVPVVSFRVGGAWEIVTDGVNGFLVPMKDTSGMVEHVVRLLTDDEERARLRQQGLDQVSSAWSSASMVNAIAAAYQEHLKRPKRGKRRATSAGISRLGRLIPFGLSRSLRDPR